jgi:uncharacterized protein (DUF433 family)
MDKTQLLERIRTDPEIMAGMPVIAGTRIPVEMVLEWLAGGETAESILAEYDGLEAEDIVACLFYGSLAVQELATAKSA